VRVKIAGEGVATEMEEERGVLMEDVKKQRPGEASAPYRKRQRTGLRVA
jgi:hypothetical protein